MSFRGIASPKDDTGYKMNEVTSEATKKNPPSDHHQRLDFIALFNGFIKGWFDHTTDTNQTKGDKILQKSCVKVSQPPAACPVTT